MSQLDSCDGLTSRGLLSNSKHILYTCCRFPRFGLAGFEMPELAGYA